MGHESINKLPVANPKKAETGKTLDNFRQEKQQLLAETKEHTESVKKAEKLFVEYLDKVLDANDKQNIIDMFGGNNLAEAVANFRTQKTMALTLFKTKTKEHPNGDATALNMINLTMLFLGNPVINELLNEFYDIISTAGFDIKEVKKKYSPTDESIIVQKKDAIQNEKKENTEKVIKAKEEKKKQKEEEKSKLPPGEVLTQSEKNYKERSDALLTKLRKWKGTRYEHDTNPHNGLDCSGLIYAGLKQLGITNGMPRVSGDMYRTAAEYNIKQGGFESNSELEGYKQEIQPGQLVFWQSTTNKQKFNAHGNRIHHVAIISDPAFTKDGYLNVIESTGKTGVREGKIDIDRIKNRSEHKSKIFICQNPSLL